MKAAHYRRQHEKALAKIVDRIVDMLIAQEADLSAKLAALKLEPETLKSLGAIQDISSRRYQIGQVKKEVRKILFESRNLLVATIVERMDN
jgi:hypothetical protein